jgi:hypothetical protein
MAGCDGVGAGVDEGTEGGEERGEGFLGRDWGAYLNKSEIFKLVFLEDN